MNNESGKDGEKTVGRTIERIVERTVERTDSAAQTSISNQSRARAEVLKKRFELRQRPEGFYLTDDHVVGVEAALDALQASQSVVFLSLNHSMARHYKELCISRLRGSPEIQLLSFDPLSGPDLLSIINAQLEHTSLDAMLAPKLVRPIRESNSPRSVLIVDSEDLVTEADWHLIVTLASQLAGANIGVLRLEPRDRVLASNKGANLSSSKSIEFELPSERELQILTTLAKHSPAGEELMRLIDGLEFVRLSPSLSDSEFAQEETLEEGAASAPGEPPPVANSVPEQDVGNYSRKIMTSNETAHLSFRLFLGLLVVEVLLIAVYFNQ